MMEDTGVTGRAEGGDGLLECLILHNPVKWTLYTNQLENSHTNCPSVLNSLIDMGDTRESRIAGQTASEGASPPDGPREGFVSHQQTLNTPPMGGRGERFRYFPGNSPLIAGLLEG
ncbi:hypothetical protein RRG08_058657 [Elysia crispata]|uniref:Uncharacterized protein n=1 Tax=Elysia crispata TaxID=231223 RepID=A0AAE0Z0N5_9GAST|nr:hypothetical protein RRG08_058657 [Elysia crispata]